MSDQNPEKKFGFDSFKAIRVKVPRNVPLPARIHCFSPFLAKLSQANLFCFFVCLFFFTESTDVRVSGN